MRGFKKCVGAVTAAAMLFTSVLPAGGLSLTAYAAGNTAGRAAAADVSVQLQPDKVSPFNDTNGDGLGEFEGWGTSPYALTLMQIHKISVIIKQR